MKQDSTSTSLSSWERLPELIRERGLRLTRQRLFLAKFLFEDQKNRHITAADLVRETDKHKIRMSLATIYNTLHQFVEIGLLREVVIDSKATYFDTNLSDHHHFFHEKTRELVDISQGEVEIGNLPAPPPDSRISRVNVVVHLQDKDS